MTLILLYVASGIAGIYLISSLGLLIGTLRNRVNFLIPWLILDLVGIMLTIALMILLSCGLYEFVGGQMQYCEFYCIYIFRWISLGGFTNFNNFRVNLRFDSLPGHFHLVRCALVLPDAVPDEETERKRDHCNSLSTSGMHPKNTLLLSASARHELGGGRELQAPVDGDPGAVQLHCLEYRSLIKRHFHINSVDRVYFQDSSLEFCKLCKIYI